MDAILEGARLTEGVAQPGDSEPVAEDRSVRLGLLDAGDAAYYGTGETLQDYAVALRLYGQAAHLGSPEASLRIGCMHRDGKGVPVNNETALRYLRRAVEAGLSAAYAAMGELYANLDHEENADKCWRQFFSAHHSDSEFVLGCQVYVLTYAVRGWGLLREHVDFMRNRLGQMTDEVDCAIAEVVLGLLPSAPRSDTD